MSEQKVIYLDLNGLIISSHDDTILFHAGVLMSLKAEESKLTCVMCTESYGPSDPEYGLVCPAGEHGPCGGTFACKICLSDMVISQCENIGDFTNNGNH